MDAPVNSKRVTKIDEVGDVLRRKTVWLLITVGFFGCWLAFGQSPQLAFIYGILIAGLIVASFIDFKHFIIPDGISLGGVGLGLLCSFLFPQLRARQWYAAGIGQSLLGIGAGVGLVYLILRVGKLAFGRERLTLEDETKIVFTDGALVLPGKEIPYDELFYRKSDAVTVQARSVKFGERHYENVPMRLTPVTLQIGDDKFETSEVTGFEVTGTDIVLPREAMGMGDVKLVAAIGAFLGWQAVYFLTNCKFCNWFAGRVWLDCRAPAPVVQPVALWSLHRGGRDALDFCRQTVADVVCAVAQPLAYLLLRTIQPVSEIIAMQHLGDVGQRGQMLLKLRVAHRSKGVSRFACHRTPRRKRPIVISSRLAPQLKRILNKR